jgi:hypothetical protein
MRHRFNAALVAFIVMYSAGAQAAGQAANVISTHAKEQSNHETEI